MLKEHTEIDRHSRWSDAKKRLDSDARYKSVDSSTMREDWFREYQKILKDERKRDKEKDRDRKDKERKEKDKERDTTKADDDMEVTIIIGFYRFVFKKIIILPSGLQNTVKRFFKINLM